MPQLNEDEYPSESEPTTHEQQVARDPVNGPKDPDDERRPGARHRERDEVREAERDTDAAEPKGRT